MFSTTISTILLVEGFTYVDDTYIYTQWMYKPYYSTCLHTRNEHGNSFKRKTNSRKSWIRGWYRNPQYEAHIVLLLLKCLNAFKNTVVMTAVTLENNSVIVSWFTYFLLYLLNIHRFRINHSISFLFLYTRHIEWNFKELIMTKWLAQTIWI